MTTPTLAITSPAPNSENVSLSKEITIQLTSAAGERLDLEALRVLVNGQIAFDGVTRGFVKPAFLGNLYVVNETTNIHIRPRRMFNYEEIVNVELLAQDMARPTPNQLQSTWNFSTRSEHSTQKPQTDNLSYATRCRLPFNTRPMLDSFRSIFLGLTATHEVFFEEALYYRIRTSEVASILKDLNIPLDIPYRLNTIGSLAELDGGLREIAVCWEGALRELHGLGVGPRTRAFLERIWDSEYPMNRVGAAAAAILLAGSLLGEAE